MPGHVDPKLRRFARIEAGLRHVLQAEGVGLALIAARVRQEHQQIGADADQLRIDTGGAPQHGGAEISRKVVRHACGGVAGHLARTKVGLALGAGGAKCYAHIGFIKDLEAAGFPVDYVAGTSMGAVVAACLAMGKSAVQTTETTERPLFKLAPDPAARVHKFSGTP